MSLFDDNLAIFNSTIYGTEMRKALDECLWMYYTRLQQVDAKEKKIDESLKNLESEKGGRQNA